MPNLLLRFDMRNPDFGAPTSDLYRAALEMAQWADEHGFDAIQISEHHGSEDGYLPSPMAAVTRRIRLRFSLILMPFNHPLVGSLPPAVGWEQLAFFAETVLPKLRS